jgi:BlaI family penicillinase repressor
MKRGNRPSEKAPIPTEAELSILSVVWRKGPSTVREVHNALSGKRIGYTTVLKQMQVMAGKGLLSRTERYRSHIYEAQFAKEQTQRQLTGNLLRRAFDGSAKNLVLGALSSQPVSASELAEIRQMLDEFEKGSR